MPLELNIQQLRGFALRTDEELHAVGQDDGLAVDMREGSWGGRAAMRGRLVRGHVEAEAQHRGVTPEAGELDQAIARLRGEDGVVGLHRAELRRHGIFEPRGERSPRSGVGSRLWQRSIDRTSPCR
jgi:hypothetical protein